MCTHCRLFTFLRFSTHSRLFTFLRFSIRCRLITFLRFSRPYDVFKGVVSMFSYSRPFQLQTDARTDTLFNSYMLNRDRYLINIYIPLAWTIFINVNTRYIIETLIIRMSLCMYDLITNVDLLCITFLIN